MPSCPTKAAARSADALCLRIPESLMEFAMSEKVAIFDTTLRDGEQAAGTRLGSREKLTIARQLARLNVDIIEAGYPASSPEDFEAVRLLARELDSCTVCALSRAVASDIEACGKALAEAKRPRIHTGIGVSHSHHRQVQGRKVREEPGREEGQNCRDGGGGGQARQGVCGGCGVLRGRRGARGSGLPFRDDRGGYRGRSHGHQYPRYHGLCRAGAIRPADLGHPGEGA